MRHIRREHPQAEPLGLRDAGDHDAGAGRRDEVGISIRHGQPRAPYADEPPVGDTSRDVVLAVAARVQIGLRNHPTHDAHGFRHSAHSHSTLHAPMVDCARRPSSQADGSVESGAPIPPVQDAIGR